mmetsp:Transcript_50480/g.107170  ORF Transcript_50480/g.107170 Transcript_50480/m.107170 type:complete len:203 (-) Transcript_50480:673-1281(-)
MMLLVAMDVLNTRGATCAGASRGTLSFNPGFTLLRVFAGKAGVAVAEDASAVFLLVVSSAEVSRSDESSSGGRGSPESSAKHLVALFTSSSKAFMDSLNPLSSKRRDCLNRRRLSSKNFSSRRFSSNKDPARSVGGASMSCTSCASSSRWDCCPSSEVCSRKTNFSNAAFVDFWKMRRKSSLKPLKMVSFTLSHSSLTVFIC